MARRIGSLSALWLAAALGATEAVLAQQAPAPPRPAAAPAPDPAFETARAEFEALPEADRKALQDALIWTGDYNGVAAGTFGRRTYDGIAAYQKRVGVTATGTLAGPGRKALVEAGEAAKKGLRFTVKPDPASGATIGVPERLLPKRTAQGGGTRWQSADGRVTLDTKSFPAGETSLDALFERATAQVADRRVTYKLKKPDFVVVTGETAGGKSYLRYAAGPDGIIRGFALGYDKALSSEIDRIVIAVANSFVPFPDAAAEAKPAPGIAVRPAPAPAAPPVAAARLAATGLIVGPGRVLTSAAAVEACPAPQIGGASLRLVKRDAARGLALFEAERLPRTARTGAVPASRANPSAPGDALVVVSADAGGMSVAPGEAGAGSVYAPLQPGAAGAPVLDRSGALVGLVARFPSAPRLIAGVMPPTSHPVIPGSAVAAFLTENGISTASDGSARSGAPETLGAVAAPLAGAVIGIDCVR